MLSSLLTLATLPFLAFALPSSNGLDSSSAPILPRSLQVRPRWEDDTSPTVWARADVKSTEASKLDIHVRFEFEGYLDGTPTFVKIKALSGLYSNFTNGGTQPAVNSFAYHIHTNPLVNGSFASAFAHLDTLNLTEGYICNPAFPKYCQNGDLSGKHGNLNGTSNGKIPAFAYSDDFVRFFPEEFSLLGRSIILHGFNKTRLAGGDIISPYDGTADVHWNPTGKPSTYNPPSSLPTRAPVQPTPAIIWSNGTVADLNRTKLDSLPYPFPFPLLGISESLNVKLGSKENTKGIKLPTNEPSDEAPPFKGSQLGTWGWSW
ncbi:hypothetical protein BDY24DRAFT_403754 [Mrakia frigida]|uniref:uncharacterized protein n=1 Tax=Mrakia frigida TaxID=29902 RepID=UPI003FCBF574